MSRPALSVRTEKLRIDRALSRLYAAYRFDAPFLETFDALVLAVRRSSPLLRPVVRPVDHDPLEALVNLTSLRYEFVREPCTWQPRGASVLELVDSLATHLLGQHTTPRFMASVWFGRNSDELRERRRWVVAHSRGTPFRRVGVPFVVTRRTEHHFLASPDHFGLLEALRRAEVLALGGTRALAGAVAMTRVGRDVRHATFWSELIRWVVAHEASLDLSALDALVEAIHELRHVPVTMATIDGGWRAEPRAPAFSLVGRTPASLLRHLPDFSGTSDATWPRSGLGSLVFEEADARATRWCLVELRTPQQLNAEGDALAHCVGSYADECRSGASSIWSIRRVNSRGGLRSAFTVEVDLRRRDIVQARGRFNRPVSRDPRGTPGRILRFWAEQESLRLSLRENGE
ncbi:MAG: PcfJ domain-containing protein [Planctomycetota bacterium]